MASLFRSLALLLPLAGCVAPKVAAPPPPPVALPAPRPAPPQTTDWRDIPLTPGDWRYEAATRRALFGPARAPVFVARCDAAARTVTLALTTPTPAPATMAITTSAGNRALAAVPAAGAIAAALPARDGFLDRMAFSRGRFVVAVAGMARLVIPAWPEFARVVEECRG